MLHALCDLRIHMKFFMKYIIGVMRGKFSLCQQYVTFLILKQQLHVDATVSQGEGCLCHLFLHYVASVRRSDHTVTHVYFNKHIFNTWLCYDVMSFVCSLHLHWWCFDICVCVLWKCIKYPSVFTLKGNYCIYTKKCLFCIKKGKNLIFLVLLRKDFLS